MKIDKDMCILDILYQTEELSYRGEKQINMALNGEILVHVVANWDSWLRF